MPTLVGFGTFAALPEGQIGDTQCRLMSTQRRSTAVGGWEWVNSKQNGKSPSRSCPEKVIA